MRLQSWLDRVLRPSRRRAGSSDRERPIEALPDHFDPAFVAAYQRHRQATVLPWQGLYTAWSAARYVAERDVEGAIVECGVYKGGCSAIMAEAILRHSRAQPPIRELYLYDTFRGMVEPSEHDSKAAPVGLAARSKARSPDDVKARYGRRDRGDYVDWCYGSLDDVRATVGRSGYPEGRVHYVEGKVEDTIPGRAPARIALLRLDTDFYESTRHELIHLYPRLAAGGVLIIDDYEAWEGARRAVDEYFEEVGDRPLLLRDAANGALAGVKV